MLIRHSNAGHWIGLGVVICLALVIASFFKLTWGFWERMYELAYAQQ